MTKHIQVMKEYSTIKLKKKNKNKSKKKKKKKKTPIIVPPTVRIYLENTILSY
jgi:hypothetical protein